MKNRGEVAHRATTRRPRPDCLGLIHAITARDRSGLGTLCTTLHTKLLAFAPWPLCGPARRMAPLGRRAAVSLPVLALAERVIPQERAAELRQSLPQLTRRPEASQQPEGRVESASVRHPDHLAQDAPARRQGAAKARSGRTSGVSKHGRSTRDVYADSDDMTRRGGSVSAARHVDLSLSEDEQLSTLSPTALSPLPSGRPGK